MAETDVLLKLKFNMSEAEKQLETLRKEIKDLEKSGSSKSDSSTIKNYEKQIAELTSQIEELKGKIEELSNSSIKAPELDTSELEESVEEITQEIQQTLNEVTESEPLDIPIEFDDDGILAQSRRLQQEIYEILTSGRPVRNSTMQGLLNQMKQTALEAEKMTEHLEALSRIDVAGNQTNDYNELRQNLNSAVEAFEALNQAREQATESGQTEFRGMVLSIEQIDSATDELTHSIEVLSDRIRSIESLDRINGQLVQQSMRYRELSGENQNYFRTAIANANAYLRILRTIANVIIGPLRRAFDLGRNFYTGVGRNLLNSLRNILSMLRQIPKMLSQIYGKFKLFSGNNDPFKKLLRNLLRYGLGISSLMVLFNKLRNNINANLKDVIAKSVEAKTAYDNLRLSIGQLSHQVTAIFEPVLKALEPLLTTIIERFTQAALAVTQFIGALTGQTRILKAKKNINGLADSAKNANKELSKLDNLNVLTTQKDSGAGDANWYEWMDIDPKYIDLWDKIKETWGSDLPDFEWLGDEISVRIENMLNDIPWEDYQDEFGNDVEGIFTIATKAGFASASFLNGLLNESLLETIGRTIANGFNTVIYFAQAFVDELEWGPIGNSIGAGLVECINTIDWEALSNTIVTGVQGVLTALSNILNNISDPKTGINVVEIRQNIEKTIIGIFNGLEDFVRDTNWGDITDKIIEFFSFDVDAIAESIAGFIVELKNKDVLKNFGKIILSILGTTDKGPQTGEYIGGNKNTGIAGFFNSLIEQTDIDSIVNDVADFIVTIITRISDNIYGIMTTISTGVDAQNLGTAIHNIFKSILDFGISLLSNDDFNEWIQVVLDNIAVQTDDEGNVDSLAEKFSFLVQSAWGAIHDIIPWETVREILSILLLDFFELGLEIAVDIVDSAFFRDRLNEISSSILEGLALGLLDFALSLLFGPIGTVVGWIIAWFCDPLGIRSPSTVFEGFGENIIQGLVNGITNMLATLQEKLIELKDKILEKWEEIKTNIETKISEIKENVSTKFTEIKDIVVEKVTEWHDNIKEKVDDIKQNLEDSWNNIKDTVSEKFEFMKETISEKLGLWHATVIGKVALIKATFSNKFKEIKDNVIDVFNQLKNGLKTPINGILSFIESLANGIIGGINSAITALNKLSIDVPKWVPEIGGESFGFNLSTLSGISIPRLAQGAVIPPNKQFLAMLGDQTNGTNIEAPLDTIKQAFMEVMQTVGSNNQEIVINMDGREILRAIVKQNEEYKKQHNGNSALA